MREVGRIRGVFLRVEGSVMPSPGSNPNRFPEVRVLFEAGDPHWSKGRDVFDGPGRLQTGLQTMFPIPDALWRTLADGARLGNSAVCQRRGAPESIWRNSMNRAGGMEVTQT